MRGLIFLHEALRFNGYIISAIIMLLLQVDKKSTINQQLRASLLSRFD